MSFLLNQFRKTGSDPKILLGSAAALISVPEKSEESHSVMPYYSALDSLQQYGQQYGQQNNLKEIKWSSDVKQCSLLSDWIYDTKKDLKEFSQYNYRKIVNANKSTQVAQWVFLQSDTTKTAFLIFKGTDINNPQDVISDLGIIPSPLYFADDGEIEISGHGLMDVSIQRDYQKIINEIKIKLKFIDTLYITGHSLGAGLSIIFGIKAIIKGFLPLQNNKTVKIITFAAPCVVVIEKDLDKLSSVSKQYLDTLCNITHVYVNRFDIVPRLLSSSGVKWVQFISKVVYKYIGDWKKHIMNESHKYMLTQNMKFHEIHDVPNLLKYSLNQIKANTIGVAAQSVISATKTVHETLTMGKNICTKTQSFGSVLNEKIIELINDEYKYEMKMADPQQQNNENIFVAMQNIFETIKKNSKNNLSLYHPFGTYYFYTSQCEPCLVTDSQKLIKLMLSYIPSRLSFNKETMQMIFANHMMTEYIKLFTISQVEHDRNDPNLFVSGYLTKIKSQILSGKPCGSGAMSWILENKKYTPIGHLAIEKHIDIDDSTYRLVFHIWGYLKYIEIKASDNKQELKDIFDKY